MPQIETTNQEPQNMPSRRQLLKALIAAGGAVTVASFLPGEWSKPVITVGVLPAHAQTSPVPPSRTPTATNGPIAAIIGCFVFNANGGITIGPSDVIQTYADITPALSGISLRRTITLNQVGHPQNGTVAVDSGLTNASGRFQPADFNLGAISPTMSVGVGRLTVLWEFVNPADGTNTCQNNVDIV